MPLGPVFQGTICKTHCKKIWVS
uniref:Uncharacterized protein n=1 Tax=Anguilla anguilla TaxID=7936 RepID=A0A0E9PSU0_ANGAN